ncbi:hypothetical protein PIB30_022342 [Stylosanthes scabra]|uniref:Uncharacterized protein n=1 Tax=Stylosanthes scabra TaxID=79078 RepID=A0ABU6VAP7_9FABA|nr:hypothetical protein [Stylosanthes scabra]
MVFVSNSHNHKGHYQHHHNLPNRLEEIVVKDQEECLMQIHAATIQGLLEEVLQILRMNLTFGMICDMKKVMMQEIGVTIIILSDYYLIFIEILSRPFA